MKRELFPFVALVGQEEMKLALLLNVVDPRLGGVLIRGEKGTGKSTVVRALADILPEIQVVEGCPFSCDPDDKTSLCPECREKLQKGEALPRVKRKVRVVELPLSATEDRLVGSIELSSVLKKGERRFEPGLLAQAHRGFLYVDEVNLLPDHLVDTLLDVAAMGVNYVEREGISFSHAARFVLVGTMNPEEGELRPQLLDRFGLCVSVEGLKDPAQRVEVLKRWEAFSQNPEKFKAQFAAETEALVQKITKAREILPQVEVKEEILYQVAKKAIVLGVDGHRADLAMIKCARAHTAFQGRLEVTPEDVQVAERLAIPHRLRRRPFDEFTDEVGNL